MSLNPQYDCPCKSACGYSDNQCGGCTVFEQCMCN